MVIENLDCSCFLGAGGSKKMRSQILKNSNLKSGAALLLSMVFIAIFATLSLAMVSTSSSNIESARYHSDSNGALFAAQSGLEYAKYMMAQTSTQETGVNYVTDDECDNTWSSFCAAFSSNVPNGTTVTQGAFSDGTGSGEEIYAEYLSYGSTGGEFSLKFYRYDSEPNIIRIQSTGEMDGITRVVKVNASITKQNDVMQYAIASRGRMWVTGDSYIHGDIYSSWDRTDIAPFNITSDSTIGGTINTVLALADIQLEDAFQLETLDENDMPMFDEFGNRIYSPEDEVQGVHEGINYGQPFNDMPGMDISDYDTDEYNSGLSDLPYTSDVEVEYFPHESGNYNYPRDGYPGNTWNRRLERKVYENETFNNIRIPDDWNALFKNCTFNGVTYIDCYKSGYYHYNNVRFDNCTFNGSIVTDVPQQFKWQDNCLYFTGEANFNNSTDVPATILAPHFNVNLGNTNPEFGDNNVLTGAIVGGIVDIRGNAQIYGTVISMCDTTGWSSGYVTNIGATLGDGGNETTEAGDVGTIEITPDDDKMLPSGITTPITIKMVQETYSEGI
jgi:type II secretory pathway pseudopilin PulG